MAPYTKWADIQRRRPLFLGRALPAGFERVTYEGYGPGGAAVLIDCVARDPEAAREPIRATFRRHGGYLAAPGAVAYLFNQVGLLSYPSATDGERLARLALRAGAEDVVVSEDGSIEVLTDPIDCQGVRSHLTKEDLAPESTEVTRRAWDLIAVSGEDARRMLHLLAALASLDDVRNVYSNAALPNEIVAEP
jgi:transcriptional/translational regulatory protein YebC/TACO1